jgi:hypothetical protein
MDGLCIRISSMRCHSQALTIKLTHDVPLAEIESLLAQAHEWVSVVPNDKESSLRELTPARGHRDAGRPDRPLAEDVDGRRVPDGLYRRRPAAVGRRRTVAADASGSCSAPAAESHESALAPRPPIERDASPLVSSWSTVVRTVDGSSDCRWEFGLSTAVSTFGTALRLIEREKGRP